MLPAKYQPNPPGGSGEKNFFMFFTIFGHGGHLEFRIKTILAIFRKNRNLGIRECLNLGIHTRTLCNSKDTFPIFN